MRVENKNLGALIRVEIEQSDNNPGSQTEENSQDAYDYFLYRPKGDEVQGRNQTQSGDVADMIDHISSEIQPMYQVDTLVEIRPENAQDVEQAEQETRALNWYFRERCRGRERLDEAVQDGLLLRNGYLKCWPEESYGLPYQETIEGTRMQVDAQLSQYQQNGEVRVTEEKVTQEAVTAVVAGYGPDGFTPVEAEIEVSPEQMEVEVTVIPKRNQILLACVAREDMFISRDGTDQDLQKPRMVAQRRWMTRNEAVSLGFDQKQVWTLRAQSVSGDDTKTARYSDQNSTRAKAADSGGDIVEIYEVYYLIDLDGDGIAERHKIYYSDGKVMKGQDGEEVVEMVRMVPFASGVPLKVSHRHQGRSIFDKIKPIEDSKRTLLRQGLDNIELANNRRPLIGPGVNEDDVEETEIGAYIRCAKGIDQYGETQYSAIFGETLQGLGYMDKMRRERGGSSIESSNTEPVNIAAHTFERSMSASEQLVMMMAVNYGTTLIRDVFVILHQQLKLLGESISFENGGEWQEMEPAQWIDRERFTVKLGLTTGEKQRRAGAYEGIFAKQMQLLQSGADGVLISEDGVYQTLIDQANLMGMVDPEQYYVDPQSDEAKQARQQKQQAAQQQAQAQEQAAQQQQQLLMQLEQMRQQTTLQMQAMKNESDSLKAHLAHTEAILSDRLKLIELNAKYDKDAVPNNLRQAS